MQGSLVQIQSSRPSFLMEYQGVSVRPCTLIFSFWVRMVTKWSHFFETMTTLLFFNIESSTKDTGHAVVESH
jgi:hypothetical protein